jgi:hypothetical protein
MNIVKEIFVALLQLSVFLLVSGIIVVSYYPAIMLGNIFLGIIIPVVISIPSMAFAADLMNKVEEKILGKIPDTGYLILSN